MEYSAHNFTPNGTSEQSSTLKDAMTLVDRGLTVVPVGRGTKIPIGNGWQKQRLAQANLTQHFAGEPRNIGVLNGEPSGWVIDIDLDSPEAIARADYFLPCTLAFGRKSAPRSHRVYRGVSVKSEQFKDPTVTRHGGESPEDFARRSMLVEIRASGTMTVYPGSVHSSGQPIEWANDLPIAEIDAADLRTQVSRLAAATLLGQYWGRGGRHDLSLALAGLLLKAGWEPDAAKHFFRAVAEPAGDEDLQNRLACVDSTAAKIDAHESVSGIIELKAQLDERVAQKVVAWLSVGRKTRERAVRVRAFSQVEQRAVRWLWPGRIPLGKLTIVSGDPDLGKSTITLDLAARVSTGREMPDGTASEVGGPAGVLVLSAEDDPEDTIGPRLAGAGADLTRVFEMTMTVDGDDGFPLEFPADLKELEAEIVRLGVKLVIIDPLNAHIADAIDAHRDHQVRRLLTPLAKLAARTGCAVVLVRHLNKAPGGNPLYRGGGSIAFTAAARSELIVAQHPSEPTQRVLALLKHNLSEAVPSLAYGIEKSDPTDSKSPIHVVWRGDVAFEPRELLDSQEASAEEHEERSDAMRALAGLLANGPIRAKEGTKAMRELGFSEKQTRTARQRLGAIPRRVGGMGKDGCWEWEAPASRISTKPTNEEAGGT